MGNKVALALSLLAVSIVVSACGGTQNAGLVGASTASRTPPPHRRTDPRKGCDAQGINSTQLGTGACTENGVQYVVANYGGVVRLNSLAVAIVGAAVAPADQGHGRTATPRRDAFMRFTIQVQNRDKVPHRFGFGQTMLGVGADDYTERTDVEKNVHVESIAAVNHGMIGPGETLRGDVVFDITEADYAQMRRVGRFFIWNFGGHASTAIGRGTGQLGQIRLYAVERS